MDTLIVMYGPDHRRQMEAFAGVEFDPKNGKHGTNWNTCTIATETLCGITYNNYRLVDGRVMVQRTDRYGYMSQFSMYPDYQTWFQWWHTDRKVGERDPETGRAWKR